MRTLGHTEAQHAAFHHYLNGLFQVVSFSHLQGEIDTQRFRQAVFKLYANHALLRSRILNEPQSHHYIFEDDVPFDDIPLVILEHGGKQWQHQIQAELNRPIPEDVYLWRVILVMDDLTGHHELIIASHHSITDGVSAYAICQELITHYNGGKKEGEAVQECGQALENILDSSLIDDGLSTTETMVPLPEWDLEENSAVCDRKTYLVNMRFNQEDTQRLLESCRAHQVSLNAFLTAALGRASRCIPEIPNRYCMAIPINLRSQCHPPVNDQEVGLFIGNASVMVDASKASDSIWEEAADCQHQTAQIYKKSKQYDTDGLREMINDWGKGEEVQSFQMPISISNIGRIDLDTGGELKHVSFDWTVRTTPTNSNTLLTAVSCHGKLSCTFNFSLPLISRANSDVLIENFRWILAEHGADAQLYYFPTK